MSVTGTDVKTLPVIALKMCIFLFFIWVKSESQPNRQYAEKHIYTEYICDKTIEQKKRSHLI